MKYYVTIRGGTLEVEVDGGRVVVDGAPFEAHLAAVPGTPLQHLLLAGESWTVAAQQLEGAVPWRLALGAVGERFEVEVVDERTRQIQALTIQNELRAPRACLRTAVHLTVGQAVDKGAPLVTVESPEPSG